MELVNYIGLIRFNKYLRVVIVNRVVRVGVFFYEKYSVFKKFEGVV